VGAQYAEAKEELILEYKMKTTTRAVKDFMPSGVRSESNFEGDVKGRYTARCIATVIGLTKLDGTAEYEGKEIDTTSDGDVILLTFNGRGRPENPTLGGIEGETAFQTAPKKLSWINGMKVRHGGTFNHATGEALVKVYGKV